MKVYIYGDGIAYNNFASHIPYLLSKVEILGIVAVVHKNVSRIDGIKVCTLEEVKKTEFDYFILAASDWKVEIKKLEKGGISYKRIIPYYVFNLPYFNWERYISVRNKDVTILSNSCLGGLVYRELGIKKNSPTISAYCLGNDWMKFVNNYEFYLSQDMEVLDEKNYYIENTLGRENLVPKGIINNEIKWNFNHTASIKKSVEIWNKRRLSVNLKNIAVLTVALSKEDVIYSMDYKIQKKLCLFYENYKNALCLNEWNNLEIKMSKNFDFIMYANQYCTNQYEYMSKIDWLKFLNDEEDYIRF